MDPLQYKLNGISSFPFLEILINFIPTSKNLNFTVNGDKSIETSDPNLKKLFNNFLDEEMYRKF